MTRARDVSRLITTPPDIYATDTESSVGYLTLSSASSTYLTQTSASTIYQGAPFRNLTINGAMQVAQRGTSVASLTTAGYRTADRWFNNINALGTWTQSVENDAPTGSGFAKSLKMFCTTADTSPGSGDRLYVSQLFEGQNLQAIKKGTASAEQLTLSFWVKSNVTGAYVAEFYDNDNTRQISKSYTISSSATWEKKTITIPADTTGAFDNDNASSFEVIFWLAAGTDINSGTLNSSSWATVTAANRAVGQTNLASATNNYWQVTGVQLEIGASVTPFEFKPYEEELRQCMRYFEWVGYYTTNWNTASTTARTGVNWLVPKRRNPDITFTSGYNQYGPGGQLSITSISSVTSDGNGALFTFSQSGGLTTNAPSTANVALKVDGEL
jgi:hypothetical protein